MNGIFKDTMANMNWRDIQNSVDRNALVLLPLGVIEEHGPQLCLGTDTYTAHLYCLAVKEKLAEKGHPVVIAPPFYWGICQSTGGFAGSFTARKETVIAMVYDIIASLAGFGYKNIFGVNAHGDIDHNIAIISAFKDANEQLRVNARYCFDASRIPHFGLTGNEPYLCPVKPSTATVSSSEVRDVHGGDIETAIIHRFYPDLVDTEIARSLPPVELAQDRGNDWLFGGHIRELSPYGYLGAPAEYEGVDVQKNISDYACRISEAVKNSMECQTTEK